MPGSQTMVSEVLLITRYAEIACKTNTIFFLMSKQKKKAALVHPVPSELALFL